MDKQIEYLGVFCCFFVFSLFGITVELDLGFN